MQSNTTCSTRCWFNFTIILEPAVCYCLWPYCVIILSSISNTLANPSYTTRSSKCSTLYMLTYPVNKVCCLLAGLWFRPLKVQQRNRMWEAQQWPEQIPRLHVSTLLFSELCAVSAWWLYSATKTWDQYGDSGLLTELTLTVSSFHFISLYECCDVFRNVKLPNGNKMKLQFADNL